MFERHSLRKERKQMGRVTTGIDAHTHIQKHIPRSDGFSGSLIKCSEKTKSPKSQHSHFHLFSSFFPPPQEKNS
jgi:hypothetical protein